MERCYPRSIANGQPSLLAGADRAVCIRLCTSDAPLFLVHDSSGELSYVHRLTPHVDPSIPIYGLPSKPADEAPMRTMEGMAMRLVRMIRAVQPAGPYRLAGWLFGGVLAYEIATQLIGADEVVQFVGLLDSTYPAGTEDPTGRLPNGFNDKDQLLSMMRQRAQAHPERDRYEDLQQAISELKAKGAMMDFATLVRKFRETSLTPESWTDLTPSQIRQGLARVHSYDVVNSGYVAQRIPIPVDLFVAESNNSVPLRSWNAILPQTQIRVRQVPGTHRHMMVTPNIEALGQALSHAMRNAAAQSKELPEKSYAPLATLQRGRRNIAPLICVPGGGASVGSFMELVINLDDTRPIYGFEPRGLDGTLLPHSMVSAAAESYLRALREVYSEGPVNLLGHSFGGWVAFEMARQLTERGREVMSLTILDSKGPEDDVLAREYNHTEAIMAWIEIFEQVLGRPLGIIPSDLDTRGETARVELVHGRLVSEGLMSRRSRPDVLYGMLHTFAMSLRTHFRPDKLYLEPVQLLLVNDSKLDQAANRRRQEDCAKQWKRWAPNLICLQVPGNHMTALKLPHVLELARFIRDPEKGAAERGRS